jgi:phage gp29-like protein
MTIKAVDTIRRLFSFAEHPVPVKRVRAELQTEMFTGVDGFDPIGWMGLFPDPDPVLRKTGDGVSALRELLGDWKVIASIQSRKLGTLKKRDYVLEPGHAEGKSPDAEATRICKDLDEDLNRIDMYNLFSQVLDAPFFGTTFVEVLWRVEGGRLRIDNLKPRPVEWFGFDGNHEPRYRGTSELMEPIPLGKLVIARHFPDATNPYGLRLLSRCLWPVAIKKGGVKFWTTFCERFGMPWVVGKAPIGSSRQERADILTNLSLMVQDAVAVVSGGTEVDVHGVDAKGGDLHPSLIEYMDKSIAMVLMGQTLTADIGDTGSRAAAQVHEGTLGDYREADETLVVMFMEDLADLYTQVNNSHAESPTFRFREPEDYGAQSDLDTKLFGVGVRFKPEHFVRRYNLAEDEFTVAAGQTEDGGQKTEDGEAEKPTDMAAGDKPSFNQQAIDDLADQAAREGTQLSESLIKQVEEFLKASASLEEAGERLYTLFPKLDTSQFQELLARTMFAAELTGGAEVYDQTGGEDA